MMEAFGLTQRVHSSVEGVAADPFVFNHLPIYSLYRDTQLTQSTQSVTLLSRWSLSSRYHFYLFMESFSLEPL